eukprot:GHVH01011698.1.p1 GENE.GHVH01011698.1~~GHVH01011698.1.p1  ORF type:complete len:190 (+),score=28.90 GHVH01011698.1:517-1086(+)
MASASVCRNGAASSYRDRLELLPNDPVRILPIDFEPLRRRLWGPLVKPPKKKKDRELFSRRSIQTPLLSTRGGDDEFETPWAEREGVRTELKGDVAHIEDPYGGEKFTRTVVLEEDDRVWIQEVVDDDDGTYRIISSVCVDDEGIIIENTKEVIDKREQLREKERANRGIFQQVAKAVNNALHNEKKSS